MIDYLINIVVISDNLRGFVGPQGILSEAWIAIPITLK